MRAQGGTVSAIPGGRKERALQERIISASHHTMRYIVPYCRENKSPNSKYKRYAGPVGPSSGSTPPHRLGEERGGAHPRAAGACPAGRQRFGSIAGRHQSFRCCFFVFLLENLRSFNLSGSQPFVFAVCTTCRLAGSLGTRSARVRGPA